MTKMTSQLRGKRKRWKTSKNRWGKRKNWTCWKLRTLENTSNWSWVQGGAILHRGWEQGLRCRPGGLFIKQQSTLHVIICTEDDSACSAVPTECSEMGSDASNPDSKPVCRNAGANLPALWDRAPMIKSQKRGATHSWECSLESQDNESSLKFCWTPLKVPSVGSLTVSAFSPPPGRTDESSLLPTATPQSGLSCPQASLLTLSLYSFLQIPSFVSSKYKVSITPLGGWRDKQFLSRPWVIL